MPCPGNTFHILESAGAQQWIRLWSPQGSAPTVTCEPETRTYLALLTSCRFGDAEERFPGNQPGRERRASTARPDPEIDTADLRERIRRRDAPLRMTCGEGVRKQPTRFRLKFEDVNRARWLLFAAISGTQYLGIRRRDYSVFPDFNALPIASARAFHEKGFVAL